MPKCATAAGLELFVIEIWDLSGAWVLTIGIS
jgi:hypothetical protein